MLTKNPSKQSDANNSGSSKQIRKSHSRSDGRSRNVSSNDSHGRTIIRPKQVQQRTDSKNKLQHLDLDAADTLHSPDMLGRNQFDYPADNLGFMASVPSILLRDVSQKSAIKSKNVSFSNMLQPPAFLNQPSLTSNNDVYFLKLRSLSRRSDQFGAGPEFSQNQSSVVPLHGPPAAEQQEVVVAPTGTQMKHEVSFSRNTPVDRRPPTFEAKFEANKGVISNLLNGNTFNPALGQQMFKKFSSKLNNTRPTPQQVQSPKFTDLKPEPIKRQETGGFNILECQMTLNTQKPIVQPPKAAGKTIKSKSKSPKKTKAANKRAQKQEAKAEPKKRGKRLEDDEDYFKKSQQKISEIKAILKTAKQDKMPVKLRQQLRNKASAQISRLKKKEEVLALQEVIRTHEAKRQMIVDQILGKRLQGHPDLLKSITADLEDLWPTNMTAQKLNKVENNHNSNKNENEIEAESDLSIQSEE